MQHFMHHAPFSEEWGKQEENVPNGGDWGDASNIYKGIPCYSLSPDLLADWLASCIRPQAKPTPSGT